MMNGGVGGVGGNGAYIKTGQPTNQPMNHSTSKQTNTSNGIGNMCVCIDNGKCSFIALGGISV